MPYGPLTSPMRDILRPLVADRCVWDLGCGNFGHSEVLVELGAQVVAIDKEWPRPWGSEQASPVGVQFHRMCFSELAEVSLETLGAPDIAFVSWPSNYRTKGLLELVQRFDTVVYLGHNLDGTVCGWPALFEHFVGRALISHVEGVRDPDADDNWIGPSLNAMMVYGAYSGDERSLVPEEQAGLLNMGLTPSVSLGMIYTDDGSGALDA